MSKRIIRCQVWEWYGSCDFTEGRYKAKGGEEFVFKVTPESESLAEDELIKLWNSEYNKQGQWYRYEALSIDYYWEPRYAEFEDGKFIIDPNV